MEEAYDTTDLSLATFAACSNLTVELDFNDPYRVIFSIRPRERGEELAKEYFFHRQQFKNRIYDTQRKEKGGENG